MKKKLLLVSLMLSSFMVFNFARTITPPPPPIPATNTNNNMPPTNGIPQGLPDINAGKDPKKSGGNSIVANENYISEAEKKSLNELRDFIENQPKELKQEMALFREHMKKLRQEKQFYLDNLSNEAKEFMKKEKEFKTKLSTKARKEFYRKNVVNQD
jgi:hypothetical protein